MKILLFYFLAILLFSINISADHHININLYSSDYYAGSTLQAEIEYNLIKPLNSQDIWLRDISGNKIKIAPFLLKLDDNKSFLYFDIPSGLSSWTYELLFENLLYYSNGVATKDEYSVNFTLNDGSGLSLNPGGIIIQNPGAISIKAKSTDDITLSIHTSSNLNHVYNAQQNMQKGKTREFKFNIASISSNEDIRFSYNGKEFFVRLFYSQSTINKTNITVSNATNGSSLDVPFEMVSGISEIRKTIKPSENIIGYLEIKNKLDKNIEIQIDASNSLDGALEIQDHADLMAGSNYKIKLEINPLLNLKAGSYSGTININSNDYSIGIPVDIEVIDDEIDDAKEETEIASKESKKDSEKQKPDENGFEFNFTGVPAPPPSKGDGSSKFIIFLAILFILGIAYYLSRRKVVQKKSFKEMVEEVEKRK